MSSVLKFSVLSFLLLTNLAARADAILWPNQSPLTCECRDCVWASPSAIRQNVIFDISADHQSVLSFPKIQASEAGDFSNEKLYSVPAEELLSTEVTELNSDSWDFIFHRDGNVVINDKAQGVFRKASCALGQGPLPTPSKARILVAEF